MWLIIIFYADLEKNPYTAPIDEDELVQLLVDALCKKGDQYAKSVDVSFAFYQLNCIAFTFNLIKRLVLLSSQKKAANGY